MRDDLRVSDELARAAPIKRRTIRRVYEIPVELHERIKAFMAHRGDASEVDAVRWILGVGIDAVELESEFRERIQKLPADTALKAAIGHPLCCGIEQIPSKRILLKNGDIIELAA